MLQLQVLNDTTYREYTNLTRVKIKPVDFLLLPEYKRSTTYLFKSKKMKILKTCAGKLVLQLYASHFYSTSLPFSSKTGDYYTLEIDLLKKISPKIVENFKNFGILEFLKFENLKSFTQVYTRQVTDEIYQKLQDLDLQKLQDEEILDILQEVSKISFTRKSLQENTFQETMLEEQDWIFIRVKEMSLKEKDYMILRNTQASLKFKIT